MRALLVAVCFLTMSFTVQGQNKPIVGVGEFEIASTSYDRYDPKGVQVALETALVRSGKFTLMERGRLDALLEEQARSASGLVSGSGKIGGFDGIDYLIYGRVTQAALVSEGNGEYDSCDGVFGVDVRVVDIATGEIRLTQNVSKDEMYEMNGKEEYGNPCSGLSLTNLTPLADEVAREVVEKMTQTIFPVKVASVKDDEVYLNYGQGFLDYGEYLTITSTDGEGFVDPDTGELLGVEEELVAVLRVDAVRAKYSIAKMEMNNGVIRNGDVANRLAYGDEKDLKKDLKKCKKSIANKEKHCAKDSSGKKCLKHEAETKQNCDLANFSRGGTNRGANPLEGIGDAFGKLIGQ